MHSSNTIAMSESRVRWTCIEISGVSSSRSPFTGDANDHLYQWDSSRDYNASPGLDRIQAVVLAINSADDERNPPSTGVLDREIKRVKNGRVLLIPGSPDTAGHGTTGQARFWKRELGELLQTAPRMGH